MTRRSSQSTISSKPLGDVRQETAEQQAEQQAFNHELRTAMTELKQSVAALRTAKDRRPPGPTDSDGVAEALRDPAARQEATKTFGIQWLVETKEMWPADALKDDEFMFQYYQLKHSVSRKRGAQPSAASVRVNQRNQRPKYADKPAQDTKIAKWHRDDPANCTCDLEGRLAEPLPDFFKDWIAEMHSVREWQVFAAR